MSDNQPLALAPRRRAQAVRAMFARIARRYDLMNRLMTAGQDVQWRKEVIRRAGLSAGESLLDLGAGTGDLAISAARQTPGLHPVAADFTLEMMQVGKRRLEQAPPPAKVTLPWIAADALELPFAPESFHAVVSGFLMRNVTDLPRALAEQYRVLKPGGRIVILDTTRPSRHWLAPLIRLHLHLVIPLLGRLIAGDSAAYTYLPDSTEAFLSAEELAARMTQAGFTQVGFVRRMFATMAIHWGLKPPSSHQE